MSIYRIDENSNSSKESISKLNEQTLELNGKLNQNVDDNLNEINQLYSDLNISRKFKRNIALGNTLSDYMYWSHIKSKTGYSIWKHVMSDFTYNENNSLYLNDKYLEYLGEATVELNNDFDFVYIYNGSYIDYASSATAYNLISDTLSYIYIGSSVQFNGIGIDLNSLGSYYTLKIEYYTGSSGDGWDTLTVVDNTVGFTMTGKITFMLPNDWVTTAVNTNTKYWIRISTTSNPINIAKANAITPIDSVESLLLLSNSDVLLENWKWCSYLGNIYVTIRNMGASGAIGYSYITSSDDILGSSNKQNYFIYNNTYKCTYEDLNYIQPNQSYLLIGDTEGTDTYAKLGWDINENSYLNLELPLNGIDKSGLFAITQLNDIRSLSEVFENPTLRIYSADATSENDYIQFYHNQTNGYIENGIGDLTLKTNALSGDTAGSIYLNSCNRQVVLDTDTGFYFGDPNTDGTIRLIVSGTDFLTQKRESGSWVTKNTIDVS